MCFLRTTPYPYADSTAVVPLCLSENRRVEGIGSTLKFANTKATLPNISLQRTLTLVDYIAYRRPSGVGNVSAKSRPLAGNVSAAELRR